MSYSEILSISKMGGLFQIVKKRTDGLIVKNLKEEKQIFVSSRNHDFTPLENITIYTQDDHIELSTVFNAIKNHKEEIPSLKDDKDIIKSFFYKIVPDYDEDRVYVSDICKIIKWYNILDETKYLPINKEAKEEKSLK